MNCIIVDDEFPSRQELKYFINNFSNIEIQQEFDNGIDVLRYLKNNETDAIFIDVNMPILDGVELSRILFKNNKNMKIIFTTAYKDYALDAFEVHAFDYLLKPYSKERIISSLERLEQNNNNITYNEENNFLTNKISVINEEKIYVIGIDEIYYIEAHGHGTKIYTKYTEYYSKNKISELQYRLNSNDFYRVHRSYIVNLKKVEVIETWFNGTYLIKMKDIGIQIPVSRTNAKEFKIILGIP